MRQALLKVEGVISATVSYENKRADVRYRPDLVAPAALIKAINDIGFKATEMKPADENSSP